MDNTTQLRVSNSPLIIAVLCTSISFSMHARSQSTEPLRRTSVTELVDLLAPPNTQEVQSRAFRPRPVSDRQDAAMPNKESRRCGQGVTSSPLAGAGTGTGSRTLEIVAFPQESRGRVDLQFDYASDRLGEIETALLTELAQAMKQPRLIKKTFAIAGHTDAQGDAQINHRLSCGRAIAARTYLIAKGIKAGRLVVFGFGSDRPLPNAEPTSAVNRRVEVRTVED